MNFPEDTVEPLEEGIQAELLKAFVETDRNEVAVGEDGAGEYVTVRFDTFRFPQGDGSFHVTFLRLPGSRFWKVVDYVAE